MLSKRAFSVINPQRCSRLYSSAPSDLLQHVQILPDASLETFRSQAFHASKPMLLPRSHFNAANMPAMDTWFKSPNNPAELNHNHLSPYADTVLPIEITSDTNFARVEQPLSLFLHHLRTLKLQDPATNTRMYIAQASLADLPQPLQSELPAPLHVTQAGKGDIYASSLWLGLAPTETPLHRDPNPNLFVQLAGTKRVRLCAPRVGDGVFAAVRERCGEGVGSMAIRGEEMMVGAERGELERVVWGEGVDGSRFWEADVGRGDGLFIPKGWWHSIRSVGEGVVGSVNWWFR
ncbi:hypothetical protein MBLNU230_g1070t1 [Neophaeotheca triangularis]